MIFTQYYLDCLSQASYLIGDETTGRAVVVDPRRDIDEYVRDATAAGLTIELVIETHFHADFLSGHLELAAATGAEIGFSSLANTEFPSRPSPTVSGSSSARSCWRSATRRATRPSRSASWSGSTPATRPRTACSPATRCSSATSAGPTCSPRSASPATSSPTSSTTACTTKLLTLPDATRVFPGHGAGSACGKNLSTETSSTHRRAARDQLRPPRPDKETFVELVTEGQPPAPEYFVYDAILNRRIASCSTSTRRRSPRSRRVRAARRRGAMIVDGRDPDEFAHGHLVGSINVGLNGRYAEFAGSVVPSDVDIVLVVDRRLRARGQEPSRPDRLRPRRRLPRQPARGDGRQPGRGPQGLADDGLRVRSTAARDRRPPAASTSAIPARSRSGTIDGATRSPSDSSRAASTSSIPTRRPSSSAPAATARRSAASVLRQAGFADVSDILGGYGAWLESVVALT